MGSRRRIFEEIMDFQNNAKMTVLQSVAFDGRFTIFSHLMEAITIIGWEWGDYVFKCYPLSQFEDGEKYDFPILQTLIMEGHAKFQLHPVINEVLKMKWNNFAKRYFLIWMYLQGCWTFFTSYVLLSWNIPYDITSDYYESLSFSFYIQVLLIMLHVIVVFGIESMEISSLMKQKGLKEGLNIYLDLNRAPQSSSLSILRIFKILTWFHALSEASLFMFIYFGYGRWARFMSAICVVMDWILLMRFCIGFHNTGLLVISIVAICVGDLGRFAFVYFCILMGFGTALTILSDDDSHSTYGILEMLVGHIYTMLEMTFGQGATFMDVIVPTNDEYIKWQYLVLQMIFLALSIVLILNLLIAVMTETHIMYEKRREIEWLHQWATLVLTIERRVCRCLHDQVGVLGADINLHDEQQKEQRYICFTLNKNEEIEKKTKSTTIASEI